MEIYLFFAYVLSVVGAPILIPGVFLLAHRLGKKDPRLGKRIALSWLAGILGLVPGLKHVTHHEYTCCFETASETRGWPLDWYGFNGLGGLSAPLHVLGNVALVALLTFAGLGVAGFLKRWIAHPIAQAGIDSILVVGFALLAVWGPTVVDFSEWLIQLPYDQRVRDDVATFSESLSFGACQDRLVPSSKVEGVYDLLIETTVTVKRADTYEITLSTGGVDHRDGTFDSWDGACTGCRGYFPVGQHKISFVLSSLRRHYSVNSLVPNFTRPGPYQIVVYLYSAQNINGRAFSWHERHRASELGLRDLSADAIRCITYPYTRKDFGVPTTPPAAPESRHQSDHVASRSCGAPTATSGLDALFGETKLGDGEEAGQAEEQSCYNLQSTGHTGNTRIAQAENERL